MAAGRAPRRLQRSRGQSVATATGGRPAVGPTELAGAKQPWCGHKEKQGSKEQGIRYHEHDRVMRLRVAETRLAKARPGRIAGEVTEDEQHAGQRIGGEDRSCEFSVRDSDHLE